MTPQEADALRAGMLQQHIGQMNDLQAKQIEQTKEWTALNTKLADKFSSGEITVAGLVERERQRLAEQLAPAKEPEPKQEANP